MSNLPNGFVPLPVNLLRFIQLEKLSSSETSLLAYIIEHSLNYQRGGRAWIAISPTQYESTYHVSRQRVKTSLTRLVNIGIIEEKKEAIRTAGGVQNGRAFRIASGEKINFICAQLTAQLDYRVVPCKVLPKNVDNSKVVPCKVSPLNLQGTTFELARYYLCNLQGTTLYRKSTDSLVKFSAEELQEFINNFIRSFPTYEFSYFELIAQTCLRTRTVRNLEIAMDSIVRQYSAFHAWVAILYFVKHEDAKNGNYECLPMFVKINHLAISDAWEKIKKEVDDLFFELKDLTLDNGRAEASIENKVFMLFSKRSLDESRQAFYSEFPRHVSESFSTNFFSVNSFSEDLTKKMNIYFRSKIYGSRELVLSEFYN